PDAVIWTESELWPNMLGEVARRSIPAALVNARISASSASRWRRFPSLFRQLMASFRIILPGGASEAAKFRALGVTRLGPPGNLKYAAAAPAVEERALEALRRAVGGRPLWLAASTHEG